MLTIKGIKCPICDSEVKLKSFSRYNRNFCNESDEYEFICTKCNTIIDLQTHRDLEIEVLEEV